VITCSYTNINTFLVVCLMSVAKVYSALGIFIYLRGANRFGKSFFPVNRLFARSIVIFPSLLPIRVKRNKKRRKGSSPERRVGFSRARVCDLRPENDFTSGRKLHGTGVRELYEENVSENIPCTKNGRPREKRRPPTDRKLSLRVFTSRGVKIRIGTSARRVRINIFIFERIVSRFLTSVVRPQPATTSFLQIAAEKQLVLYPTQLWGASSCDFSNIFSPTVLSSHIIELI